MQENEKKSMMGQKTWAPHRSEMHLVGFGAAYRRDNKEQRTAGFSRNRT
jgi:hypothetical protein